MKEGDTATATAQLQGVLQELSQSHDENKLTELADHALLLLKELPSLDLRDRQLRAAAVQLHTAGISLWNRSVALKSAGAISLSLNAQMRHIACTLVLVSNPLEPSETVFHKQMTMATKTGRAWLDCDNPVMAENSLALASNCWEKFSAKFPGVAKETANSRVLFRVLCFRAEAAVAVQQHEAAFQFVQQAKELLHSLENEVGFLSMQCYNFGLDTFQQGDYDQSVAWLKESYEIGKGSATVGAVKQARTLRLLANSFLEWEGGTHWQKALNAVGLANSEHSHPAGLLLKTSILLQHDPGNERLSRALEDTLQHANLTTDMALATIRLAAQNSRQDLAFSGIRLLCKRFQSSPDLVQIRLLQLELLIEGVQRSEAKQLVEDLITAHHHGNPLEVKTKRQLHIILWEQAAHAFESSDYDEAVTWYNYSLSLFPVQDGPDKNVAKLQRNRCSCYIALGDFKRAEEAIRVARQQDPECGLSHFLAFKVALHLDQEEEAIKALGAVGTASEGAEETIGVVCLAAQLAFEKSYRQLATLALEKLAELSSSAQQILTALRCLARLKLTCLSSQPAEKLATLHSLLSYLSKAWDSLSDLRPPSVRETEASWFMKVAWNLALQCGEHHQEMAEFFDACHQFSSCVPQDSSVLLRQKTCRLMSAAACLQVARASFQDNEKVASMETVLQKVSDCRAICQKLPPPSSSSSSSSSHDPTPLLLVLYEFEAKLHLGHPNLEDQLEGVAQLPGIEPKTFETIAALALRGPKQARALGLGALRQAIRHHLRRDPVDYNRLSKCYHSLVQVTLGNEGGSDMASKEQTWAVLSEVLGSLNETEGKKSFPEMEVLWFMAKAWNCGIHLYSSLRFKEAEQWCSMGMRFLKHLTDLQTSYEEQMTTVYTEVLSKIQSHQMHTLQ